MALPYFAVAAYKQLREQRATWKRLAEQLGLRFERGAMVLGSVQARRGPRTQCIVRVKLPGGLPTRFAAVPARWRRFSGPEKECFVSGDAELDGLYRFECAPPAVGKALVQDVEVVHALRGLLCAYPEGFVLEGDVGLHVGDPWNELGEARRQIEYLLPVARAITTALERLGGQVTPATP